jgi:hypothetical protein
MIAQFERDSELNDTTGDKVLTGLNISVECFESTSWAESFTKGCFVG